MKTLAVSCALASCLGFAVFADAQTTLASDTLLSPRPGTEPWSATPPAGATTGNGTSSFESYGLAYAVPTATGDDAAFRTFTAYAAPSTSNWSASVNVHLAAFSSLASGQYVNLNLIVVDTSNTASNTTSLAIDRYGDSGVVVASIEAFLPGGAASPLVATATGTTDATLRIDYDATAKTLTYLYDSDGAGAGATFLQVGATTGDISGWAMSASDTFGFLLVGGSGSTSGFGPTVASADAYFTSFAVTAVPEPSAYAALIGALALAAVAIRRRRAA